MTKNNGGPAFPQNRIYRDSQGIDHEVHDTGMSLRDWFAGHALNGLYAGRFEGRFNEKLAHEDARIAYLVADAMIAARNE